MLKMLGSQILSLDTKLGHTIQSSKCFNKIRQTALILLEQRSDIGAVVLVKSRKWNKLPEVHCKVKLIVLDRRSVNVLCAEIS